MPGSLHPPSNAPLLPTLTVPVALTSFVGREREIAQIKQMLTTARLVTLTGAGGSGKSRLALQVATQLTEEAVVGEGVCWVELVSLANPDLVPQSIASALTLREVPHESFLKTIAHALRAKQLLLVLDNCEHLINACAHIANDLLTRCPRLKILATSRERLGINAEQVFPVPLLSLPGSRLILDTDQVAQSDAIRLFVERAQAVKPDFSLTNLNVAAIAQVCRRLDGIPLAIELAATRVRVLAVEQIAARLEDRFSLLTADSRAALPRHQTLRATLDWSNELLTASEQILFQRFAIFAGGGTLEAAEAVCSGEAIQSGEVLDLISRLVDKSLVIVQEQEGVARYHYLDTIRAYAYEKLQASGELKQIQERHFDFFLGLAQQTETARFFSPSRPSLKRYSLENDNFRAALDSSLAEPDGQKALQLAGALIWVWSIQSYWSEGLVWLRRALAFSTGVTPPGWGTTLLSATYLNREGGDYQQAIVFGEQSLAIYREKGDPLRLSDALGALGSALSLQGEVERAIPILEECLGLYREQENELCVAECLNMLADSLQRRGDPESSIPLIEESLSIARKLQDEFGIQRSLALLAGAYRMRGDFAQATLFYNQAMTIRVKNNYIVYYPWAFEFYAILAVSQMQPERAARLWGAAHRLREASGWRLPPAHRHYLDYERDTLNQLGSETFARLLAEGGATPVEEMLEYAMAAPVPAQASSTNQMLAAAAKPNFGGLTVREREIARLIAEGKTNREIADQLVLSTRTVGNHVGNILGKLGFHSRTQVAMWAVEQGLSKD